MYLEHFGLAQKPFALTPDTAFFLRGNSHLSALNTLLVALEEGEGFIKITGEVGTGKTLLCRILLRELTDLKIVTAYVPNPQVTPEELKRFVAAELGAPVDAALPAHELTALIYRELLKLARQGRQCVLLIDEAQAMSRATLEAVRLLSNLETERQKLLQIVLFGQPELDRQLDRKSLRQLRQRIVFQEKLAPLSAAETATYLAHRLTAAGASAALIEPAAARRLARIAGGVPRLINILAHKALLAAYGEGAPRVALRHVRRAAADTPAARHGFWQFNWIFARPQGGRA